MDIKVNKNFNFLKISILLAVIAIIGFFVYPKIAYQADVDPTITSMEVGDNGTSVTITWDPPTDTAGLSEYKVYLDSDFVEYFTENTYLTIYDLTPGADYSVFVEGGIMGD